MAEIARRRCLHQSEPNDELLSLPSLTGLHDSRIFGMLEKRTYFSMFDWSPISELHGGKKRRRRLTSEQLQSLEKSFFEGDCKLVAEKKNLLAQELGMQPRQVGIWFQNRRARLKSQQLHLQNDALMADNHNLRAQVAELKAELEACKNNGKDIVLKSVNSESETEFEANEPNQIGKKMSRTIGKYNLSKKCSKASPDAGTPKEKASGGGIDIDIDIDMDMDGDNFSSVKDVSAMGIGGSSYINLMKYGDAEGSYCSFLTHPHFDYSDSYSGCSLWD